MSVSELEINDEEIKSFLDAIKAKTSYDFTNYSIKSLKRRIAKILAESRFSMKELENEVLSDIHFLEKVVKSITVNTTEMFRDPDIWINFRNEVLPKFESRDKINIWHAGCSTGQEVYSMMILLEEMNLLAKSEIYASDINSDVMETAKAGKYKYRFNLPYIDNFDMVLNGTRNPAPGSSVVPTSKYFVIDKVSDTIQMKSFLTEKPSYKKIDLVKDDNLFQVKFDMIICRNVIIYFNYDLQNKVFNLFYNSLFNNGCLLLGLHESILGPYTSHFEKKNQVYFKKEHN